MQPQLSADSVLTSELAQQLIETQLIDLLARPERFELPTSWFVARHSIQLSYGRAALASVKGTAASPKPPGTGTSPDGEMQTHSGARILPYHPVRSSFRRGPGWVRAEPGSPWPDRAVRAGMRDSQAQQSVATSSDGATLPA